MNHDFGTVAFIGAGNMASAMIKGLVSAGISSNRLLVSSRGDVNLQCLRQEYGIEVMQNNRVAASRADIIILATKPNVVVDVYKDIANVIKSDGVVVSVAAGITIKKFEDILSDAIIVRAMPNVAAGVGQSASVLYANNKSEQVKQSVSKLFSMMGSVHWLDKESDMSAATALAGSGPAYFYLQTEAMIAAGQDLGLSLDIATALARQTLLGAANYLEKSEQSCKMLRDSITSPNGTTAAALRVMKERGVEAMMQEAMLAAWRRSEELKG